MIEGIILGIVQGVAEWLPVSSEGLIVLVKVNFFGGENIEEIIKGALLLHLGTFLAALVYFRKDVWHLLKAVANYKQAVGEDQKILKFLLIATIISGVFGYLLLGVIGSLVIEAEVFARWATSLVAILLFITAGLQLKAKSSGQKGAWNLADSDSYWLGLVQALAALPGLSRSGLTVATLLLRNFDKTWALKLSFLMSLPIVLGGNIILNYNVASFSSSMWWGLLFSFIFGLLTIDLLIRLAHKINFGYFVLVFAVLTLVAVFI